MHQLAHTSFLTRRGLGLDWGLGGVVFCCGAVFAPGLAMETLGLGFLIDIWFVEVDLGAGFL